MRIMVVEDDFVEATRIAQILRAAGHTPSEPVDSLAAAMALAEDHHPPDLAIIDIGLSEGRVGVELARYLYRRFGLPYIYVTGFPSEAIWTEGVLAVLPKPFEPSLLLDLVGEVERGIGREGGKPSGTE